MVGQNYHRDSRFLEYKTSVEFVITNYVCVKSQPSKAAEPNLPHTSPVAVLQVSAA